MTDDARIPAKPGLGRTPAARSTSGEIDTFLGRARAVGTIAPDAPRLIFALDATMSRQPTWDLASQVQAGMFDAAAGSGLLVQLVYFRGLGECRASRWVADPRSLRNLMTTISCRSGNTQIGRVLAHVADEASRHPVKALVYVGDAMEEGMDALCGRAGELGLLGVKAFMFREGGDPAAQAAFAQIARLTGGAALSFDRGAPAALAALLRAVAAYAAGGAAALRRLAAKDGEARRLLAAMPG